MTETDERLKQALKNDIQSKMDKALEGIGAALDGLPFPIVLGILAATVETVVAALPLETQKETVDLFMEILKGKNSPNEVQ
jgi:hypothetical protein